MSETRTEKEIIAEAYSDEAAKTWRAPVQRYPDTIPWPIHLEAYAAYVKRWSTQTALIDLKGRHCRGGFGAEELDLLVPGWRDRVSYIGRLEARVTELEAAASKPVAEAVKVKRVMDDPCIAKLKDDEPFFVLLGRDPDAAHALSTWFSYRVRREGRSSKTDAAEKTLDAFRAYRDGDTPPQPEAQGDNAEEPVAWTTEAQLDGIKGTGNNGVMWGEPLPHHPDIPLYTHPCASEDKGWHERNSILCDSDPVVYRGRNVGTIISPTTYRGQPENIKDRWEPLYRALASHPCTSTPVVSQNAPDLEDKGEWVLVPKEPTEEMVKAGESWSGLPAQTWTDMIDAAPVRDAKAIPEHLFMDMLAEMERRMKQPKHVNVSEDGYEADGNPEWLPLDDTQVGVEFAVEYMNRRLSGCEHKENSSFVPVPEKGTIVPLAEVPQPGDLINRENRVRND